MAKAATVPELSFEIKTTMGMDFIRARSPAMAVKMGRSRRKACRTDSAQGRAGDLRIVAQIAGDGPRHPWGMTVPEAADPRKSSLSGVDMSLIRVAF